MKTVIFDIINFLRRFWTILLEWIKVTVAKYKFKNLLLIALALYSWFFAPKGGFFDHFGTAIFFTWVGINLEALMTVYRELKKKNGW